MAVGKTCAGLVALVDDRLDVREPLPGRFGGALLPRVRYPRDLVGLELGDRADVPRRRDDDLLVSVCWPRLEEPDVPCGPFELRRKRRELVRDDPDEPAGRVGSPLGRSERERLRGRAVFVALAERAARNVCIGPVTWSRPWGAGPARAKRRDDHPPAGEGVAPELSPLGIVQPPSFDRSRPLARSPISISGRTRSSGSGRMIIDERSELISSIVCR